MKFRFYRLKFNCNLNSGFISDESRYNGLSRSHVTSADGKRFDRCIVFMNDIISEFRKLKIFKKGTLATTVDATSEKDVRFIVRPYHCTPVSELVQY
jgi:hypothetical protein